MSAPSALARRTLADSRVRTIGFAYLFAAVAYLQPVAYRHSYPSAGSRLDFARSFGDNKAIRLFYGVPHDLLSVGGYTAWRVGGTLAIFAAVFGLLASVRALRTEEDAGRSELVLAGVLGRRAAYLSAIAGVGVQVLVLWAALWVGLVLARLPAGQSAFLALSVASVIPVFAGVGALASQAAPTRRIALELGGGVVVLALLARVIADTASGVGWLRWLSPLGWAEEMRPFTGGRPLVVLLPVAATAVLLWAAMRIAQSRDVGSGLIPARDSAAPRLGQLSSPTAFALRSERGSLLVWGGGVGAFAFILGVISNSISSAGISKNLQRELEKLGSGSILTPSGYLGFTFIFFVLAVSLFCIAQIGAARHEEADEQLETMLALPVSRRAWLSGRLWIAVAAAVGLSLLAGALAWGGAASAGVSVSLPRMLEAGANCLPVALLFLGVAALAYGLFPRASAGIAYGLVVVAFLWQLFGSLLGAPHWLVELTPFAHVGLVPAEAFRAGAAAVMIGAGALAAGAAVLVFERRDLLGA